MCLWGKGQKDREKTMTAQAMIDDEEIIATSLEAIADDHNIDPDLLAAFVEMECLNDLDEVADRFQDQYAGTYDSLTDWAEEILEETGGLAEIPERLRYYFSSSLDMPGSA
jgi:antirestriction protein